MLKNNVYSSGRCYIYHNQKVETEKSTHLNCRHEKSPMEPVIQGSILELKCQSDDPNAPPSITLGLGIVRPLQQKTRRCPISSSPLPLMSQHTQRTEATEGYKIFGRLHREAHTENGFKAASEDSSMQGVVFYMVHTSSIHTLARKGQDCPLT